MRIFAPTKLITKMKRVLSFLLLLAIGFTTAWAQNHRISRETSAHATPTELHVQKYPYNDFLFQDYTELN